MIKIGDEENNNQRILRKSTLIVHDLSKKSFKINFPRTYDTYIALHLWDNMHI